MQKKSYRRRRSALYVPASNAKALAKISQLASDCVIIDLEDAVAPDEKASARQRMVEFFSGLERNGSKEMVIRINALTSPWGVQDLAAARACQPDAILVPKVESVADFPEMDNAQPELSLWAMIETPQAVLNIADLATAGRDRNARLACLVVGTNDLIKDTRISPGADRALLLPWLMQIILAGRAGNLDVLDGVANNFSDMEAFAAECAQGRDMGFDGKTLIHPAQIAPANSIFAPSELEVEAALAIRAAFALPENRGKGVIALGGKMVECLHLQQAEQLLARAGQ